MSDRSTAPASENGSGCLPVIVLLIASGYLFYSGCSAVQTKQADIRQKGRGTQHVSGDRAVNHGIFQLVLGFGALGVAGYQAVRFLNSNSPPPPSDNSSVASNEQDQGDSPSR